MFQVDRNVWRSQNGTRLRVTFATALFLVAGAADRSMAQTSSEGGSIGGTIDLTPAQQSPQTSTIPGTGAKRCRITDPTGTSLNVRAAPNGTIVGTLENGRLVAIVEVADAYGKPWAYVRDAGGQTPLGWVYREFVSCF